MTADLQNITGFRGEKIFELRLTDIRQRKRPLFYPGFLGDKWPAIDFYVELRDVTGRTPYFFAQVKATARKQDLKRALRISAKKNDVRRLLEMPGPTYIFGVHEPSERVFVQSIHLGAPVRAISSIPISHELTSANLKLLHNEVKAFWGAGNSKPYSSVFA